MCSLNQDISKLKFFLNENVKISIQVFNIKKYFENFFSILLLIIKKTFY